MKCPHCKNYIHVKFEFKNLGYDSEYNWYTKYALCPSCQK